MTKFIKVTEVYKNGGALSLVIINASQIKSIKISDKGADTHIHMTDAKYYFVKESVDEIWDLLK